MRSLNKFEVQGSNLRERYEAHYFPEHAANDRTFVRIILVQQDDTLRYCLPCSGIAHFVTFICLTPLPRFEYRTMTYRAALRSCAGLDEGFEPLVDIGFERPLPIDEKGQQPEDADDARDAMPAAPRCRCARRSSLDAQECP